MKLKRLNSDIDIKSAFKELKVSKEGIEIMAKKANLNLFLIKDIKLPAANILKQDALSIGAELAVPYFGAACKKKIMDAILIASDKQLELLIQKEKRQPFKLKDLAEELEREYTIKRFDKIKIMGVVNVNSDSFYSGSRFLGDDAIKQIKKLILEGADIIDIGASSSRPGSEMVDAAIEIERLKSIFEAIKREELYKKAIFSIDSYNIDTIKMALDTGFRIINDITGLDNKEIIKLAAKYDASVILMHMKGTPKTMQDNPEYEDVIFEISEFFEKRIEVLKEHKIKEIILDVGIGFGKTVKHNLLLIKHLSHFRRFGYELLIGASRKSLIDKISQSTPEDRLPGTIVLHIEAIKNGATILRVHDVKEHIQAIKIYQALKNTTL